MNRKNESFVYRALKDQRGQMLPVMALMLTGILGMAALSIDLGRAYVGSRELQASTNAAALAGAQSLPNSTAATAAANAYSSASGDLNANANLPNVSMVVGYPKFECLAALTGQGEACVAPSNANAIQVQQQSVMPMFFSRIFGKNSLTLTATSTASMRGAAPSPYNVAIIVDTTLSMSAQDDNCGATQITCALNGVQVLLNSLSPCAWSVATCTVTNGFAANSVDRVALFTFPNVTVGTAAIDSSCTTPIPNPNGTNGYLNNRSFGNYVMEPTPPWSGVPTGAPYSFPTAGASTYAPPSSPTSTPTYQLTGFFSDYRASDTASVLNTGSALVKAAGGKTNCGSVVPPNYDGDIGTYFAGALYAAQSALIAEQAANPGSQNVIILLGDGNADSPQSITTNGATVYPMPSPATNSGTYPSYKNQCGQAVTAAQYATSKGTRVYAVAYGSLTSGCTTDTSPTTTPCLTLQAIASAPANFYSDYLQSGSGSTCYSAAQPTTNLSQIFTEIAADLTVSRLIPNGTN